MSKELNENICKESVFAKIYQDHIGSLSDFLYYKFGEHLEPSDKAQDAFVKLWENCDRIAPSKAKSFLFTTANNMMLNAVKHQKVVLKYQRIDRRNYTNESPEFILEKQQFSDKYQRALSLLSDEQRVAFLLSKVEGKKHQDIAEMLNVTKKVVEYRIYSAFKILREEVQEFKGI